jgi:tetrahydromethanopterin S-methyltransferase subunit C
MQELLRHPIVLFVVSFVLMSIAAFIGNTVVRKRMPIEEDSREDFKLVQSATLTLLALVIGFNLSMAVGRYDQRKNYGSSRFSVGKKCGFS